MDRQDHGFSSALGPGADIEKSEKASHLRRASVCQRARTSPTTPRSLLPSIDHIAQLVEPLEKSGGIDAVTFSADRRTSIVELHAISGTSMNRSCFEQSISRYDLPSSATRRATMAPVFRFHLRMHRAPGPVFFVRCNLLRANVAESFHREPG
jgi:hypothetical protein